jgi:hypothetical protein
LARDRAKKSKILQAMPFDGKSRLFSSFFEIEKNEKYSQQCFANLN